MKSLHRFRLSKVLYALLIIVALPIDIVFAKQLDEVLEIYLPQWMGLPLSGCLALLIGVGSYYLYLWQIEKLTKK